MLKTFEDSKLYYLILRIHSLKYLKIYDIGCKDMGIIIFLFVAKTQFQLPNKY